MSDLAISITIILCFASVAAGWDLWLAFRGRLNAGGDFCDGLRALNRWSGGLFVLLIIAVLWHTFGWLPASWK